MKLCGCLVYGQLFSDFWEILGLGLYGTLCLGNRLNIFGSSNRILKVISEKFATFSCSVFGGRNRPRRRCEFSNHESTFEDEMANEEKQDDQEKYENEVIQLHTVVGVLTREKKNPKSNLTRMLNQLTLLVSEELYDRHKVVEPVIERFERLRDDVKMMTL